MENLIQVSKIETGIVKICLDRAAKRNALNLQLMEQLTAAFTALEADQSTRVVIVAAEGSIFSSGMDLNESKEEMLIEKMAQHVAKLFKTIYTSPLISIAAVQGDAIAGGAGLVLACDMALMADGAAMGFPETRRGLVAAQVAALLLRQIRARDVKELLLLGEQVIAKRCLEMGLVNRIVSKEGLLPRAIEMAKQVMKGAPLATKHSKAFLGQLEPRDFIHDLELALSFHQTVRHSEEAREGISAFLEKRKTNW